VHDAFLRDFWQQRPLLVRGAFPDLFDSPAVTPDQLLLLACFVEEGEEEEKEEEEEEETEEDGFWEEDEDAFPSSAAANDDVAARLILNQREVAHGPFEPSELAALCAAHPGAWSLLVNDVERHVPKVHAIAEAFSVVPTWRHDDVMVSWAARGGGIGAHVDSYDVFLLQGSGTREWEVAARFLSVADEAGSLLNDGRAVRVLQPSAFQPTHRWTLAPGDFLYLPPRVAHRGRSLSADCTTVSVGFRLPTVRELVAYFADHATQPGRRLEASNARLAHALALGPTAAGEALADDASSTAASRTRSSGRIDPSAVAEAKAVVRAALLAELDDDAAFGQWFGSTVRRLFLSDLI
jgi:50S ribosomal protein L16 3-hydroxylase